MRLRPVLPWALPLLLFGFVLLATELGRLSRQASGQALDGESSASAGSVTGTVSTLMGLVLAFSFYDSSGRLGRARQNVLNEGNAIANVWKRIDLAEPATRPQLLELLGDYLDARIRAHAFADPMRYREQIVLTRQLEQRLWSLAVQGTSPTPNRTLLLSGLGEMGNCLNVRTVAAETHLTPMILGYLVMLVLLGSFLIGSHMPVTSHPHWLYDVELAVVLSSTVYVILDMEYPRFGPIQLMRPADAKLLELRELMRRDDG